MQSSKVERRLVDPPHDKVRVHKSEEKGTDVNLACHMLMDAILPCHKAVIIISNDADFREPIYQLITRFDIFVTVLCPASDGRTPSCVLMADASKFLVIKDAWVQAAQLPKSLKDAHGIITRPSKWDPPDEL